MTQCEPVPSMCDFPLVRDRFWPPAPGEDSLASRKLVSSAPSSPTKEAASGRMGGLRALDLRGLPHAEGPPTELRVKKDKLAFFERQCTPVGEGLYVGAEAVAKSREALREAGIARVVNCVGFLYPAYFEDEMPYKTLHLQDTPGEDILCVLYDVFDFIEEAHGGHVLVHCSQGVSRSVSLVIAYLMWKHGAGYDEVFAVVKAARGVANPNIGFICQLLQWHKRRAHPSEDARLYRIAPQSSSAPRYLVPKLVACPAPCALDPRGAFVLQTPAGVTAWLGSACPDAFAAAAARFVRQLQRYEGAVPLEGGAATLRQGSEPPSFWEALQRSGGGGGDSPGSPGRSGSESDCSEGVGEVAAYDFDFQTYFAALSSRGHGGDSGPDSARSGRKTPRDERRDGDTSPNARLRKHARALSALGSQVEDVIASNLPRNTSMDTAAVQLEMQQKGLLQQLSGVPPLQRCTSDRLSPRLSPRPEQQQPNSPGGGGCARPAVPPLAGLSRLGRRHA